MRIGHGYDVHRIIEGRKLILCGVEIPWDGRGLDGHSDADVAIHALMDAILGAASLGDIGQLFPDTDPRFEGADSTELLKEVCRRTAEAGYSLGNFDITILEVIGTEPGRISVKATTEEGLGFTGAGEGIAAHAVVLLEEIGGIRFL